MDATKHDPSAADRMVVLADVAQLVERRLPKMTEARSHRTARYQRIRTTMRVCGDSGESSARAETAANSATVASVVPNPPPDRYLAAAADARFVRRFIGKLSDPTATGCREFLGARYPDGYGKTSHTRRTLSAHRAAYAIATGQSPDVVRHRCDNPACCEPSHLQAGTQADNVADAVSRERHPHGERHGKAKLTADQVRTIRLRRENGDSFAAIATDYGVTDRAVRHIVAGNRWKVAA